MRKPSIEKEPIFIYLVYILIAFIENIRLTQFYSTVALKLKWRYISLILEYTSIVNKLLPSSGHEPYYGRNSALDNKQP